jgi:hypothetical protein
VLTLAVGRLPFSRHRRSVRPWRWLPPGCGSGETGATGRGSWPRSCWSWWRSPLTFDEFRAQDFPTAGEIGNTFQYYYEAEAEFTGSRDIALIRVLNPQLQNFRSWLRIHPVPAQ